MSILYPAAVLGGFLLYRKRKGSTGRAGVSSARRVTTIGQVVRNCGTNRRCSCRRRPR